MRKSLKACPEGITKAERALISKAWSQEDLANQLKISRQPVGNFFRGNGIDPKIFVAISEKLELNWQEIAGMVNSPDPVDLPNELNVGVDIDGLVQEVRKIVKPDILERCGTMRVLDMTQPIGLNDIYTSVNILEQITGRKWLYIPDLLNNIYIFFSEKDDANNENNNNDANNENNNNVENFERFRLRDVREKRVPGLEAVNKYSKLMILGKPGAGKTTFLKHLAIQCVGGMFQEDRIPIFITLKDFADAPNPLNLLDYLIHLFANYGIAPNTKVKKVLTSLLLNSNATVVEYLLKQGKLLILLDGLDEVKESDSSWVVKEIKNFTTQFHRNQFVITCRIAAREYTLEQFTEIEIADFDQQQIDSFANKWFQAKDDIVKAERFIQRLEEDKPIQELATNPLLLTMLCLVFEESGNFPSNRSELYKEGLDVLLKKWDTKRNIERNQVYKKLSLKRKEDLLCQIALETFEQSDYFFKQKVVERYISQYIRNLPEVSTDQEALQLDSEAVLKSIEAQHGLFVERARGIYSFSHLTFHEYFVAKKLFNSSNHYAADDKTLQSLATHITEKRWREVFLLTVGMLESADSLLQLMKHQINMLLVADEKLLQFLTWVNQKSRSVEASYKPAAVRAFYFLPDFARVLNRAFDFARAHALDRNLTLDSAPDLYLAFDFALDHNLALDLNYALILNCRGGHDRVLNLALDRALDLTIDLALDFAVERTRVLERTRALNHTFDLACNSILDHSRHPELHKALQQLKDQLPNTRDNPNVLSQWWRNNSQAWAKQLRSMMIQYRNIGHDWQFSDQQKKLLKQYYDANKLLFDCLNSDCYVSRKVRQEIEDTLLLPVIS